MKITTTDFEHNYHTAQKFGSQNVSDYIVHNIDVYNKIDDFYAVYQTAQSYYNNDYNTPNDKLELSRGGGTDKELIIIDELHQSDIDDLANDKDALSEIIARIDNSKITTLSDIQAYYDAINDNLHDARAYMLSLDLCDDV